MAWDWAVFLVGVAVGGALMWAGVLLAGRDDPAEGEEHWR